LDPPPDRDVVNRKAALRHDLLQIAVREGVSQVPPNAQEDDHVFEMPPAEQYRPSSGHVPPYQISSGRICNRTGNLLALFNAELRISRFSFAALFCGLSAMVVGTLIFVREHWR